METENEFAAYFEQQQPNADTFSFAVWGEALTQYTLRLATSYLQWFAYVSRHKLWGTPPSPDIAIRILNGDEIVGFVGPYGAFRISGKANF